MSQVLGTRKYVVVTSAACMPNSCWGTYGKIAVIKRSAKCSYCYRTHSKLCDAPNPTGTCDTPMCAICTWSNEPGKDYCRKHRAEILAPKIQEKIKAEREANRRPDTLVFIAHSKYPGTCRDKDCGARWERDDPMYWDSETREVFCESCGEMML